MPTRQATTVTTNARVAATRPAATGAAADINPAGSTLRPNAIRAPTNGTNGPNETSIVVAWRASLRRAMQTNAASSPASSAVMNASGGLDTDTTSIRDDHANSR